MTLEIVRTERSYIVKDEKKTEQLCEKLEQAREELKDLQGANSALARKVASVAENRDFWYKMTWDAEAERDKVRKEAQEQSDLVQCKWLSPCQKAGLEALVETLRGRLKHAGDIRDFWIKEHDDLLQAIRRERQIAKATMVELKRVHRAAHVHDRSCGELAQTVRTERAQRREAERRDDAPRLVIDGVHEALDECQIERNYDDGQPASTRTRVFWLNQRATRAEALAQLVNEEAAELLDRLAACAYTVAADYEGLPEYHQSVAGDARKSRELAAQIREALDDSQA